MPKDPKSVVEELFRRIEADDLSAIDDLMAEDMVNHAAPGRPARDGWKQILSIVKTDLGADSTIEHHHLFGEGDLVAHHMTIRGCHEASTMPLLAAAAATPTGREVTWTYIHIWRVVDGKIVEHWACRDDLGLVRQVGAWPPGAGSTRVSDSATGA
jgi:lactoylglutathione lyase